MWNGDNTSFTGKEQPPGSPDAARLRRALNYARDVLAGELPSVNEWNARQLLSAYDRLVGFSGLGSGS